MATIAVLPPELASQIAAGEIAERPANVAKELIENALDAAATRCDVEVEGGGITRLCVSDDGHGMTEEEAHLSLERHATSKLRSVADLGCIASYGFRGEALPSIASVSRLCLRSRTRDCEAGVELQVVGGSPPTARAIGIAVGTRIEVNDLFFNVPARRKFLRSSATEAGHVTEVVENAALARPDVTFSLVRDGRRVREFLRVGGRADRVRQVLSEIELADCEGERGPLRVEAFLSRPETARAGASGLHVFVNGRPVRDRSVMATVAHAYGSVLERGRYPLGVVYLDLPFELVDVNVHPQKSEVRFADPRAVTDALYGVLSRALATAFSLPPTRPVNGAQAAARSPVVSPAVTEPLRPPRSSASTNWEPSTWAPPPAASSDVVQLTLAAAASATTLAAPPEVDSDGVLPESPSSPASFDLRDAARSVVQPSPNATWSSLRFVTQLRQTYLLCEGDEGIYLLDQHAAAERVTFSRLKRAYRARKVASQVLLFPALVDVTSEEAELVDRHASDFLQLGVDARRRGTDSVSIHSVPKLLARGNPERLFRDLLTEVSRNRERAFSDSVDLALATLACHGSLRAGDALGSPEALALLRALDEADFAGHCPHGRPVVTFIGWTELERKVGRR